MRIPFPVAHLLSAAAVGLAVQAGCRGSSQTPPPTSGAEAPSAETGAGPYDPHDKPLTEQQKTQLRREAAPFPKAVEVVQGLRNTTEEETKNGIPENPYNVHQALDKVDLVLGWLPEIARDSGVPKERWEEVNTTANDLRMLFEEVHQNIDNRKHPDFASVASEIDQKIARLQEIAQAPPAAKGEKKP